MQTGQRLLMMLTVVIIGVFCCFVVVQNRIKKEIEQWEYIGVEVFLHQVVRKKEITLNEYRIAIGEIRHLNSTAEIEIEVYRKEWDLEGKHFYSLLTWEEVQNILKQENSMELQEGSIVRVIIQQRSRRKVYSAVISGKEYW